MASFYPILRLLLPQSDIDRESYGIRTKTLGKLFIKALAISPNSEDAKKLTFELKNSDHLDYGDVVYDVMKTRSPPTGTLSIAQVNQYLDLIGEHFKNGERQRKFMNVPQSNATTIESKHSIVAVSAASCGLQTQ